MEVPESLEADYTRGRFGEKFNLKHRRDISIQLEKNFNLLSLLLSSRKEGLFLNSKSFRDAEIRTTIPLIYFTLPYIIITLLSLKVSYFRYLGFALVLLFLIPFVITNNQLLLKKKYFLLGMFILLYSTIGFMYSDPVRIIKNLSTFILSLAPFFIFDWVFSPTRSMNRVKYAKILSKTITLVLMYTIGMTLYYLFSDPYIARHMTAYDPSTSIDTSLGINVDLMPIAIGGGFNLIYGVILLPPIFLFLAKSIEKNLMQKIFYTFLAGFLLYFIIKSGFATAFILSSAGCVFSLVMMKKYKIVGTMFSLLAILTGLLIVLNKNLLEGLIFKVVSFMPSDSIISIRLSEIVPALYMGNQTSSFSGRLQRLEKTITAFLDHYAIGVGYIGRFDYISVESFTGFHTEWLDILAQYGLIMGIPWLLFIGITLGEMVNLFKGTVMHSLVKLIVVMIILVGFLNPILHTSIFIIALIFIPSLLTIKLESLSERNLEVKK